MRPRVFSFKPPGYGKTKGYCGIEMCPGYIAEGENEHHHYQPERGRHARVSRLAKGLANDDGTRSGKNKEKRAEGFGDQILHAQQHVESGPQQAALAETAGVPVCFSPGFSPYTVILTTPAPEARKSAS